MVFFRLLGGAPSFLLFLFLYRFAIVGSNSCILGGDRNTDFKMGVHLKIYLCYCRFSSLYYRRVQKYSTKSGCAPPKVQTEQTSTARRPARLAFGGHTAFFSSSCCQAAPSGQRRHERCESRPLGAVSFKSEQNLLKQGILKSAFREEDH